MQIEMLAVTTADIPPGQYTSSYLVAAGDAAGDPIDGGGDLLAVDAGCLGFWNDPEDQMRVKHVLLTHAHADHIASLPLFLENVYDFGPDCPTLYGSRATLDALRAHVFNGVIWPDFIGMSTADNAFCRVVELEAEAPARIAGFDVLPVAVDHAVPTLGYILSEAGAGGAAARAAVFAADSRETDRLWAAAAEGGRTPVIAFLEASFPDSMSALAELSAHLTPATLATEAAKLPADTRIVAVHVKPRFKAQIAAELDALGMPHLVMGRPNQRFGV